MILSDRDIMSLIENKGVFLINPYNPEYIQACSVDLHLGEELKTIDGKRIDLTQHSYKLKPQEFILGCTLESVNIPVDLVARVEGRSSIGRLGIMIHITAGLIDPGYHGQITLEIYNASDKKFELEYGGDIAQIVFETLTNPCLRPYGSVGLNSKYQGSKGTVNSKYEK